MSAFSVGDVLAAIPHIRAEADFNRSFTDGRRPPQSQAPTETRNLAAGAVWLELGRSDDRV